MDYVLHVTNTDAADTLRVSHPHFGSFLVTIPGRELNKVRALNPANFTAGMRYDRRAGDARDRYADASDHLRNND